MARGAPWCWSTQYFRKQKMKEIKIKHDKDSYKNFVVKVFEDSIKTGYALSAQQEKAARDFFSVLLQLKTFDVCKIPFSDKLINETGFLVLSLILLAKEMEIKRHKPQKTFIKKISCDIMKSLVSGNLQLVANFRRDIFSDAMKMAGKQL